MVVKVVVEESAAGYRCSLLFFLVVGTIFCESEADLLMQIVNDAQLSGIRTCWINSDDLESYTRYFQMMLDQHYGSEGAKPSEQKLLEGERYLLLVKEALKFSREVKVIYLG